MHPTNPKTDRILDTAIDLATIAAISGQSGQARAYRWAALMAVQGVRPVWCVSGACLVWDVQGGEFVGVRQVDGKWMGSGLNGVSWPGAPMDVLTVVGEIQAGHLIHEHEGA
ncbi:MAG: hypothetical protein HC828_21050 [Blastochloris sp.]|nr:hypothetical protein [Blastochloris sp.]